MAATEFTPIFLILAITLVLLKITHPIMRKINLPEVLGEILIGIVIGPSLLGLVILDGSGISLLESLLSIDHETMIIINSIMLFIAEVAVLLLLFEVGLEMNISGLKRSGKGSIYAAIGGVVVPFIVGILMIVSLALVVGNKAIVPEGVSIQDVALFFGATITATSIGISVRIFMELDKLHAPAAKIMVGAAVIDDIIAILLLSFAVVYFEEETAVGTNAFTEVVLIIVSIILFFVFVYGLSRVLPKFMNRIENYNDRYFPLVFSLIIIFFLAWFASFMQLAPIIGAFIAGTILNRYENYSSRIMEQLSSFSHWIVPIFFIAVGLRVDLGILFNDGQFNLSNLILVQFNWTIVGIATFVIIFAILAKIIGSGITTALAKESKGDSLLVGLSMSARGEVVLIFAAFALDIGIFTTAIFSSLVLLVITTSIFVPIALKFVFAFIDRNKREVDHIEELPEETDLNPF
jgi:Kef-type K+ transport system membrane component KefB